MRIDRAESQPVPAADEVPGVAALPAAGGMRWRTRGAGPAVLFVHGLPTSGRLWDFVVDRLAASYTCIVVDLPGCGAPPWPAPRRRVRLDPGHPGPLDRDPTASLDPDPTAPLDPDALAAALDEIRARLGLAAWSVVGHDAGAVIAVHYAAAFPARLRRLALLSPPIFPELRPPRLFRLLRLPVAGDLLAPLAALVLRKGGLQSMIERRDRDLREVLEDFARPFRGLAGSRRLLRLVRWGQPAGVLGRTASLLPGVRAPTLVLHGRRDPVIPASFATRAAAAIPGCRAVLFDSGHFLPLDVPADVGGALAPFL
jgi:pimeloyl-ACP methyl ester carboxylesterase